MAEADNPTLRLPSVDAVLRSPRGSDLVARFGRGPVTTAIRLALAHVRQAGVAESLEGVTDAASAHLELGSQPRMRTLLNLTGTILHTNLGRALLAKEAIAAASSAMRDAVALEFDLTTGKRGERDDLVRELLIELTGAEDATVVNNNAAAVLLGLNTFAEGKDAIVSRGELIEIGGAFRMPDIMARAGCRMVEVGTTNRTHPSDYRAALSDCTGVILKVHTSNYRIEGFTTSVSTPDLAPLARECAVPLLDDLGSGTLVDLVQFGLPHEPTVAEAIHAGADLVTFSGDKLLGGPQAGFIVGRKDLIARINRNPLKRALRVDKIRLAAIEATLRLYRDPETLKTRLPTIRDLARTAADIRAQAERLAPEVAKLLGNEWRVAVDEAASQVGSGAVPTRTLPSAALTIRPVVADGAAPERLAAALRGLPTPVIGRIADGALWLDLRCLADDGRLLEALAHLPR